MNIFEHIYLLVCTKQGEGGGSDHLRSPPPQNQKWNSPNRKIFMYQNVIAYENYSALYEMLCKTITG